MRVVQRPQKTLGKMSGGLPPQGEERGRAQASSVDQGRGPQVYTSRWSRKDYPGQGWPMQRHRRLALAESYPKSCYYFSSQSLYFKIVSPAPQYTLCKQVYYTVYKSHGASLPPTSHSQQVSLLSESQLPHRYKQRSVISISTQAIMGVMVYFKDK